MEQNSLAAALCMTTLAGLSTGLGGLLVLWRLPGKKLLARSLGFAAGVMLAVSLGDLTPMGMEYFSARLPPAAAGAAAAGLLLAGMLTGAAMDGILPEEKTLWNSIAGQDADDRRRALHCGVVVGLALVAHNLPEGILTLFSGVQDPGRGCAFRWLLRCTICRRASVRQRPSGMRPIAAKKVFWLRLVRVWQSRWGRCWPTLYCRRCSVRACWRG